ncbi:hypothetical protein SAMN05421824_0192 [Hyunsoonleella jejuensis]|uniref:Uncharacterized protein n=1 Tax=Hyunsoonleella jejuensis TaxID=419940 RepID=A0A1H9ABW5_9FLAO|nr:hypothetical protein [Hyunsoonleella jejuensis]SEP73923.1 hypothetical protein SAMN05421824_0192 [Hyunsoonleella jejuensis]
MNIKKAGMYAILGILFFLPVTFLLFLYPATHNYTPLDIVNENVLDLNGFSSDSEDKVVLKDYITVLGFLGDNPMERLTAASNLKELVYDKFKGFKKFQVVLIAPQGKQNETEQLRKEISLYEDLRFLHVSYGTPQQIKNVFNSLKHQEALDEDYATDALFIIDKDLNQRGRIDDRTDNEIEKNTEIYGLNGYDCIEVATIKNKMSEDLRILFTEYRQKRKGEFNSDTRRASDLKKAIN